MGAFSKTFQLSTLTPVAVISPEMKAWSTTRNVMFDQGNHEICILDTEAVQGAIKDAGKEKAYKASIKSSDNFNLRRFLLETVGLDEFQIDELVTHRWPANGYRSGSFSAIQRVYQAEGQPTIPAAQLTEALHAAMLYDWLVSEKENGGAAQLTAWVEGISSAHDACRPFFSELRTLQDSYRRNPERLNKYSIARLEHLQEKLAEQLNEHLKLTPEVLFGKEDAGKINIVSSEAFAANAFEVQAIGGIHLETGDIAQIGLAESVSQDAASSFHLEVGTGISHPYLKAWEEKPEEELLGVLYDFASELAEFERDYLSDLLREQRYEDDRNNQLRYNEKENLEALFNIYDNFVEEEIDSADDDTAYLRLRRDGAYYGQTYALALFRQDPDAYDQFMQLYGFMPEGQQLSALRADVTLKLEPKRGRRQPAKVIQPLGWVKVRG